MRRILSLPVVILFAVASFSQTPDTTGSSLTTFPRVVAKFHRCGLTEELPTTTIFTPTKPGLFRISEYLEVTVANGQQGGWEGIVLWDNGVEGGGLGAGEGTSHPQTTYSQAIGRDLAGKPITVRVFPVNDVSGTEYNVTVVVEQLIQD